MSPVSPLPAARGGAVEVQLGRAGKESAAQGNSFVQAGGPPGYGINMIMPGFYLEKILIRRKSGNFICSSLQQPYGKLAVAAMERPAMLLAR